MAEDRAYNGFGTNFENCPEPIYGTQFLPRKFKIAVTVPGDNSVDLFTNDIGVVVMSDEKGEIQVRLQPRGSMVLVHCWNNGYHAVGHIMQYSMCR